MKDEAIALIDKMLEVSPYLALLVLITIAYILIFRETIKQYKELIEVTEKNLKEANDTVISALKDAYKDMKGGR